MGAAPSLTGVRARRVIDVVPVAAVGQPFQGVRRGTRSQQRKRNDQHQPLYFAPLCLALWRILLNFSFPCDWLVCRVCSIVISIHFLAFSLWQSFFNNPAHPTLILRIAYK